MVFILLMKNLRRFSESCCCNCRKLAVICMRFSKQAILTISWGGYKYTFSESTVQNLSKNQHLVALAVAIGVIQILDI